MTTQELYELFKEFKENDFRHLQKKVDWIFYLLITGLVGLVFDLVLKFGVAQGLTKAIFKVF